MDSSQHFRLASRLPSVTCSSLLLLALGVAGCGDAVDPQVPDDGLEPRAIGASTEPALINSDLEFDYGSLDATSAAEQSGDFCALPNFSPSGFIELQQTQFANLIADYAVGWMNPMQSAMLGLDEVGLFKAFFESASAAVSTDCNENTDSDLEGIPPDDALSDPDIQQESHDEIVGFLEEAELLSSGETLRLSFHDCEACDEPLGQSPFIVEAQLTDDGVLSMSIELVQGNAWTETLYLTPDALVFRGPLGGASDWLRNLNEDTRSGDTIVPNARGTVTAVAVKDESEGISARLGISGLTFDLQPGSSDTFFVENSSECFGAHIATSFADGRSRAAADLGNLTTTIPGSVHCGDPDYTDCDANELASNWIYSLGDATMVAEQPPREQAHELEFELSTGSASTAKVGESTFATIETGGGSRGGIAAHVDVRPDGYEVRFAPRLTLSAALTISTFSEKLRFALPEWLQDEIFDVSLGGDARSSIFVPLREMCPDDGSSWEAPERREVKVTEGSIVLASNDGTQVAEAGTCLGASLVGEEDPEQTSSWVELGFACE